MFVVAVFFEAKRGHADDLRAALVAHAAESRANEPGCEHFDVSQDPVDPESFLLYEVFASEAAFNAHHELEHYARFAGLVEPWVASKRILTYTLVDTTGMV
jgi:autoinducer 2-degrading protein